MAPDRRVLVPQSHDALIVSTDFWGISRLEFEDDQLTLRLHDFDLFVDCTNLTYLKVIVLPSKKWGYIALHMPVGPLVGRSFDLSVGQ